MYRISKKRAQQLLRGKRILKVFQPDERGVVRELVDEGTGEPYVVKAKKVRRAVSGKQNLMLCTSGQNSDGNAFFAAINEIVSIDRFNGNYVILSPKVVVANTKYGASHFSR